MHLPISKSFRIIIARLCLVGLCTPLSVQGVIAQASIRTVKVLGGKGAVEVEVEASDKLMPQTQVLSGPDRLVIDFPNATPSNQLRSQSVNVGEVKDLRVGLFQNKPPVTRVVLDLKTAQSFQVFPYGRTVMIKVSGSADNTDASTAGYPGQPGRPSLIAANYTNRVEPIRAEPVHSELIHSDAVINEAPAKPLDVTFNNGLLTIHSNKATLSEVLFAVQQRTGAEVSIAPGAEQEKVVVDIGPAPAPEVLAQLLNGSKFNFLILNAAGNSGQLDRVILSPRPERVISGAPLAQMTPPVEDDQPADPQPQAGRAPVRVPPSPQTPGAQGEGKTADDNSDQ